MQPSIDGDYLIAEWLWYGAECSGICFNLLTSARAGYFWRLCSYVHIITLQVARCIGSHVSLLLRDLIILFKDDYIEVLKGLAQNLTETVDSFSRVLSPDRVTSNTNDLLQAIISCEQLVSVCNDWRLQELLLDKLSCLTRIFSSDLIHNKLIPIVFNRLHNAVSMICPQITTVSTLIPWSKLSALDVCTNESQRVESKRIQLDCVTFC